MNTRQNQSKEMLLRAVEAALKLGAAVPAPGPALVTGVQAIITEINDTGGDQSGGFNQFRSGASLRREAAKELRQTLAEMALTARILDKTTQPGLAELMSLGKGVRTYQALQNKGRAFIDVVTPVPIKTAFTGRGYAATFIEDLTAQIAKLDTSAGTKYGGLNQQVNSTRGLTLLVSKGVSLVRDLDDLLSRQLRKTDPAAYQEWKLAVHVRSRKKKAAAPAAEVISNHSEGSGIGNQSGGGVTSNQSGTGVIGGSPAGGSGGAVTP